MADNLTRRLSALAHEMEEINKYVINILFDGKKTQVEDPLVTFKWLVRILSFQESKTHLDKHWALIIDSISKKIFLNAEGKNKDTRVVFKNYLALKKCSVLKKKLLKNVRCKLCEAVVRIENLAHHSFMCFESKTLRTELDKINKTILKLKATCAKTKTTLRRLCLPS